MPRKTSADSKPRTAPPAAAPADPAALSAAELARLATEICGSWPGRLPDSEGRPGGLIEFPGGIRPIIIGDLHANLENLKRIIDHEGNREDFEAGRAALVLVGDAMHDDRTGHMREMASSVAILDYLLRLIVGHPRAVYYLRGNHDTFDSRLRKSGIAQGEELRKALVAAGGPEYAEAVGAFFEALPMFIIGEGFVITHAGPPHGGLTREELVDIKRYPEKYHQLMWNRVNEFHGTPSPKEYGEKDLRLTLELLGLPLDTPFIVGHNPLRDGNDTGVWLDVIGIKNHHILYSGSGSRAPYLTLEGGALVAKLTIPKRPEGIYYG